MYSPFTREPSGFKSALVTPGKDCLTGRDCFISDSDRCLSAGFHLPSTTTTPASHHQHTNLATESISQPHLPHKTTPATAMAQENSKVTVASAQAHEVCRTCFFMLAMLTDFATGRPRSHHGHGCRNTRPSEARRQLACSILRSFSISFCTDWP
jgi:hypothetical protein